MLFPLLDNFYDQYNASSTFHFIGCLPYNNIELIVVNFFVVLAQAAIHRFFAFERVWGRNDNVCFQAFLSMVIETESNIFIATCTCFVTLIVGSSFQLF
jgi:hypothetical protein